MRSGQGPGDYNTMLSWVLRASFCYHQLESFSSFDSEILKFLRRSLSFLVILQVGHTDSVVLNHV